MSIYATMFTFGIARFGVDEMVELHAQSVPAHIDYTGPEWDFLPLPVDPEGETPRAVLIVEKGIKKGTARCGQEYTETLITLTGKEWEEIRFVDLMRRLEKNLEEKYGRGPDAIFQRPDGRIQHLYGKRDGSEGET